ncbi:hypothetical protein WME41_24900, partial [Microcoleus anatoxicus PTRS3]
RIPQKIVHLRGIEPQKRTRLHPVTQRSTVRVRGFRLGAKSIRFQEARERDEWHPRISRAQVGLDKCLEVAIPWADLQIMPDWSLRLIAVLSEGERYCSCLPFDASIAIGMP